MVWWPGFILATRSVAWPSTSATVSTTWPSITKVTYPLGVPAPGARAATVTVNRTSSFTLDGFFEDVSVAAIDRGHAVAADAEGHSERGLAAAQGHRRLRDIVDHKSDGPGGGDAVEISRTYRRRKRHRCAEFYRARRSAHRGRGGG